MKKILFLLFFILQPVLANPDWQRVNILSDSWVNDFTIFPTEPKGLAVSVGIFRFQDPSHLWYNSTFFKVGDSLVDYYGRIEFLRLTRTNNVVLASIKGGSYAISKDKGTSWELVQNLQLGEIRAFLAKDNIIYAGTDKGIFISADDAKSWNKLISGLGDDSIMINEIKSDNFGNIYFCSKGKIIILNKATNICRISNLIENDTLSINSITFLNDTAYLATDKGIFISTDSCATWFETKNIFTNDKITSIESVYGYIFIGTAYNGFFKANSSFDIYGMWSINEKIGRFVYYPEYPSPLYVLGYGLLNDNDNAFFFTGMNYHLGYSKVKNMFQNKKSFTYFITDGNTILSKTKANWYSNTDYLPLKKQTLYYGVDNADNIYYSDFGYPLFRLPAALYADKSSWKVLDSSLVNVSDMLFLRDGSLFALNLEGKVYLSKDNGENWEKLPLTDSVSFITNDKIGNFIAVGTDKFFISSDDGYSWQIHPNSIKSYSSDTINTYKAIDGTIFAATSKGILYTTDKGNSWTLASGVPTININNILVAYNELYASSDSGVIRSLDNGRTWSDFSEGLPRIKKGKVLNVDNEGFIYYGSDFYGLYKSTEHVDGVMIEKEQRKSLFGDFPDVISDEIQVSYFLDAPNDIQLSIINMLGYEVALLDKAFKNSGEQSFKFNLSGFDLSSGLYFLKLNTLSETSIKKIFVVK